MANNLWKNVTSDPPRGSNKRSRRMVAPLYQGVSIVQWDTLLPDILCDELIKHFTENCPETEGYAISNKDHRKVVSRWALPGDWVPSFISNYINIANEQMFQFDLCGIHYTECHMLEYGPGHYYHWHADAAVENTTLFPPKAWAQTELQTKDYVRKISYTLQLSNEDEYTGGDVQLIDTFTNKLITVPKKRGSLVLFDSRISHRVKPVKTGNRTTLVGWALGPKWR